MVHGSSWSSEDERGGRAGAGKPADAALLRAARAAPGAGPVDGLERLLPKLESGMIPKMEACLRAIRGGVRRAHVIDGRLAHSVLLEVFTSRGVGTMVVPKEGDDDV